MATEDKNPIVKTENENIILIKVSLLPDERGFIGRECPTCKKYFKVKPGTGLPTLLCHCPYCDHFGSYDEFNTKDQVEYAKSKVLGGEAERRVNPDIRKLLDSFKEIERATRGLPFQIKVKTEYSPMKVSIKDYQEKEVETYVICDNCGLEFAIYGVFANCPDCNKINAFVIFNKSIEVSHKRLNLLDIDTIKNDFDLKDAILEDALSGGVSSFDAFGKVLQSNYSSIFPQKTKNLFQKLETLSEILLKSSINKSITDIISKENFDFLFKMFQVRHIYEHNKGVVDDDFINKVPNFEYLKGRKYPLEKNEIEKFLTIILETGNEILKIVDDKTK